MIDPNPCGCTSSDAVNVILLSIAAILSPFLELVPFIPFSFFFHVTYSPFYAVLNFFFSACPYDVHHAFPLPV